MDDLTNWSANHHYRAQRYAQPTSVSELAGLIDRSHAVRMLGSRHSFNDIADSDELLISTAGLPEHIDIDADARTVTVNGGIRYSRLAAVLHEAGWALANLASLPHISVAGAIATATHGSGVANQNLAGSVSGLFLIASGGRSVNLHRGDRDFDGAVVALGALGAVVDVTLDIQPTFDVRQRVFTDLPWQTALESFDEVMSAGYSVSLFTRWVEDAVAQVWVKERVDAASADSDGVFGNDAFGDDAFSAGFFGAVPQTRQLHMIDGMDVRNTTEQGGVAGPWSERLAHFRSGFTPSGGEEIQSEYLLPRAEAARALQAIRELGPRVAPLLLVSEIRTVAADTLWLSTASERDVVAVHFTWKRDEAGVRAVLPVVEDALLPLGARPHWAKVYLDRDGVVPGRYPRLADFRDLAARVDPAGVFRNDFVRRILG